MTLPPWLHYAESGENLDDFILSPIPPTLETLPALTLAFECAKESILSPTGLTTLNQTFAQKDIPSAVFEQELNESEIYVIKWIERERKESTYNREPFHITPENLPNKAVVVGNIFIDLPVHMSSEFDSQHGQTDLLPPFRMLITSSQGVMRSTGQRQNDIVLF